MCAKCDNRYICVDPSISRLGTVDLSIEIPARLLDECGCLKIVRDGAQYERGVMITAPMVSYTIKKQLYKELKKFKVPRHERIY